MGNEEINSNATDKSNANDHGGEINSASEGADTSKEPAISEYAQKSSPSGSAPKEALIFDEPVPAVTISVVHFEDEVSPEDSAGRDMQTILEENSASEGADTSKEPAISEYAQKSSSSGSAPKEVLIFNEPVPAVTISVVYFEDEVSPEDSAGRDMQTILEENSASEGADNSEKPAEVESMDGTSEDNVCKNELIVSPASFDLVETPEKLPESGEIYKPTPIEEIKFIGIAVGETKTADSFKIYQNVINSHKIRVYKEEIYVFSPLRGIYYKMTDQDFDRYIIGNNYIEQTKKKGGLKNYNEVRSYIKKDPNLNLREIEPVPEKLWVFQNGIYDIQAGIRVCNDGSLFLRNMLQCNYNEQAKCPRFDYFIEATAGDDENVCRLLWEVIGYLLSDDTKAKVFFQFFGEKDSGKSLLGRLITRIVGVERTSNLSPRDLAEKFALSDLKDKTLNVFMDMPNAPLSPETIRAIKVITGRDTMYIEEKFKAGGSFNLSVRLLFGSNYLIRSDDQAFMERLVVVPFSYQVPKDRQNVRLEEMLFEERDGICMKAMRYYQELVKKNYMFTKVDQSYYTEVDDMTVLKYFSDECCNFTDSDEDKISSDELYNAYVNYCEEQKVKYLSISSFSTRFNFINKDRVEKKKIRTGPTSTANGYSRVKLKNRFR